jgi:hypothetical protein
MAKKGEMSSAMQFGLWLGRLWRAYLRVEEKALMWLVRAGASKGVLTVVGWIFKAVVIATFLYVAFWLTLIILFITVGALTVIRGYSDPPGWRYGPEGYGYYEDGVRTDFGRIFEDDR